MTDRELLELAAKAAGLEFNNKRSTPTTDALYLGPHSGWWNPLTDDGDALRLSVKLGIQLLYLDFTAENEARWSLGNNRITEYGPDDPYAAARRAIVRAAAEIGRNMP